MVAAFRTKGPSAGEDEAKACLFYLLRVPPGDGAGLPSSDGTAVGRRASSSAPMSGPDSVVQGYSGHGSGLAAAAFSSVGQTLVTAGASDGAILQWRVLGADSGGSQG